MQGFSPNYQVSSGLGLMMVSSSLAHYAWWPRRTRRPSPRTFSRFSGGPMASEWLLPPDSKEI